MTLSCKSPFNSSTYAPGIFINQVTVVGAVDVSGTQLPFMERPIDIGLKLTLDIGRDFQPELLIAGNFKRDPKSNEVVGWGSAFVVQEALARLGYTGTLEGDNRIPADVLAEVVGKHIYRLSYVSGQKDGGKLRYSDWNQIATLEEGGDDLLARFKKSLTRGYPKNYKPDLLTEPAAGVPTALQTVAVAAVEDDPF